MGIETSADHGGAESSFTSANIAIEELAKVDPSVSVMCDVHNTLVNTVIRKYGSKEQQDKWLPQLAESKACHAPVFFPSCHILLNIRCSLVASACQNLLLVQMHLLCRPALSSKATIGSSMDPRCGSPTPMKQRFSSSLRM